MHLNWLTPLNGAALHLLQLKDGEHLRLAKLHKPVVVLNPLVLISYRRQFQDDSWLSRVLLTVLAIIVAADPVLVSPADTTAFQ